MSRRKKDKKQSPNQIYSMGIRQDAPKITRSVPSPQSMPSGFLSVVSTTHRYTQTTACDELLSSQLLVTNHNTHQSRTPSTYFVNLMHVSLASSNLHPSSVITFHNLRSTSNPNSFTRSFLSPHILQGRLSDPYTLSSSRIFAGSSLRLF